PEPPRTAPIPPSERTPPGGRARPAIAKTSAANTVPQHTLPNPTFATTAPLQQGTATEPRPPLVATEMFGSAPAQAEQDQAASPRAPSAFPPPQPPQTLVQPALDGSALLPEASLQHTAYAAAPPPLQSHFASQSPAAFAVGSAPPPPYAPAA